MLGKLLEIIVFLALAVVLLPLLVFFPFAIGAKYDYAAKSRSS